MNYGEPPLTNGGYRLALASIPKAVYNVSKCCVNKLLVLALSSCTYYLENCYCDRAGAHGEGLDHSIRISLLRYGEHRGGESATLSKSGKEASGPTSSK